MSNKSYHKKITVLDTELAADNLYKDNVRLFVEQLQKYSTMTELTRDAVWDLIDNVVVHEATGDHLAGTKVQELVIHYRLIGQLPDESKGS